VSAPYTLDNPLTSIPLELDQPKLLIGEGVEEVLLFGALLTHLGIGDVRVEQCGGKDGLPAYLDALRLRPGFAELSSLGVTRDADADAMAAFNSVRQHLQNRGFVTPISSGNIEAGTPRVGIMILPDGASPGMLEDLCLTAFETDAFTPCINGFFECLETTLGNPPDQMSKARLHVWLAAQNPPDMRLGIAAQRASLTGPKDLSTSSEPFSGRCEVGFDAPQKPLLLDLFPFRIHILVRKCDAIIL